LCVELVLFHAVDTFVSQTVTPDFIYFRLHGGKGFKHVYTDVELQKLSGMIPRGKPAYVMFNNINMVEDALRFVAMTRDLTGGSKLNRVL
ncbi:MAG: hypothetical protein JWQ04_3592, partial [Pedosphaera sp.]|nr:hypothetical protein [Pedosphaera sp.]